MSTISINNFKVELSNLDKVLWPKQGYTKGDLINYYIDIYPLIQDFLAQRPLSLKSYPDGINGKSFFQKNAPDYAPHWLSTYGIYSRHRKEAINWITVNKLADLVWVANRASIELHSWFSTINKSDEPSFAVFDLDPGDRSRFKDVIDTALVIKKIIDEMKLIAFLKTSGKSGLHIYIPIKTGYNFTASKIFLKSIAEMVIRVKPGLATIEWRKKKRDGKVYIDYRQNGRGKTLPVPYSIRPTANATISTPLNWDELTPELSPEQFTLANIANRLKKKGDLWSDILQIKQSLPSYLL
ncbi:MAG: DNA polymerase domain-containing protein [Firmicutes bacterium]|nr:DNA polymerase domain-containing protein [Bacillota bacterium]